MGFSKRFTKWWDKIGCKLETSYVTKCVAQAAWQAGRASMSEDAYKKKSADLDPTNFHDWVAEFLRKLDKFEKESRKTKIIVK